MLHIRGSVFETNSSSVHSLTFISKEEFTLFESGKAYFDRFKNRIIPIEDLPEEDFRPHRYLTPDSLEEYGERICGEGYAAAETLPDGGIAYYVLYYGEDR